MRFYVKLLVAAVFAATLQVLVASAGGWDEVSFEARCLVTCWNSDPALRERLIQDCHRLLEAERERAIARAAERVRVAHAKARVQHAAATKP